ncbi:MAG: HAD-IG family 5'-nucleotidase [Myxococcales bacterium]|jgi:HAD superfamily 5'-nucleotidase-like hydrolase|nr:HAD-IG family 5'-nucleotidase [Myxococcales bacterium]MBL0194627.1 HAD-IG family 5'-nucleotidase [Myxococcales bacterium]HQY63269.1 HAD-IG family 5'-nucleotidase [Polyangiaceae bacterium]
MTNDDKAASESGATGSGDATARLRRDAGGATPDAAGTGGQLFLPLDDFLTRDRPPRIARQQRVFCNRNLRLAHIAWVGFDMDYTLAIYNQAEMDRLSIEATLKKLIARGYPEFIQSVTVPTDFAVRGLLIDKRFGHVLKMDRYKNVSKGFHGFRELSRDEIRALYHSKKIRPATPRYHWIDTLYALSEAVTYASLVQALEDRGFAVDYAKLFTDIRECIDEAHRDGTILDAIAADLPRFVLRDADLAPTLHKLRSSGKRLFLLTNSRWAYTERMMTYLLGGSMNEYPSWRNFFDVVIVAATKPAFFQERRPLLEHEGDRTKPAALPLERGKVYEGGNLQELERAMGVAGDQVLYVGDHIYGDILRSKKDSAWRTAMIIQELETEVSAYESCRDDLETLSRLEELRERHEDDLRFYQARIKDLARQLDRDPSDRLEAERARVKRAVERIRGVLRHVESESLAIERRADARFHAYWGSLMKDGNEQSSFGKQVDEYACIYTSRVSNLGAYSPTQFFRSPRDVMAHEIGE